MSSAAAAMNAPLPPNIDRGPQLLAACWTTLSVATIMLAFRIFVRLKRRTWGLDDWFMVIAWVLDVVEQGFLTGIAQLGGFRHAAYIPPANVLKILYYQNIDQPFGAFCAVFGKVSVALLILRLMGATSTWRRMFLHANIVLYFAITLVNVAMIYAQCTPTKALWMPQLVALGQATCWSSSIVTDFTIFQSSFGAYLDFALAAFPILIFSDLAMSRKKRFAISGLLGLGVFAGICAVIKTVQFPIALRATDPTWSSYTLYLWASLELSVVIIAGCVPPAIPLWDALVRKKPLSAPTSRTDGSRGWSAYRLMPGRSNRSNRSNDVSGHSGVAVRSQQSDAGSDVALSKDNGVYRLEQVSNSSRTGGRDPYEVV